MVVDDLLIGWCLKFSPYHRRQSHQIAAHDVLAFVVTMVVDEELWWDGALVPGGWVVVGSL